MSTTTEAAPFVVAVPRRRLGDVVPFEYFRPVRLMLMLGYLVAYLMWLRIKGLPIDRISVAISVGIFLVCAFVGKTWRTWGVLLVDCIFYCVMWFAYERTRGAADDGITIGIGSWHLFHLDRFDLQVESTRNIDRFLFFGHDPNVVLQHHFWERSVRWYDVVASSSYMTHFVLPVIVMGVLWAISHRQWVRFMKRFATLLLIACLMFVVLPTAPPWMVGSAKYPYRLFAPLHRDAGRGFRHLGFLGFSRSYTKALGNGNGVAAMPSLHASFALITPAFFLPWIKPKWLKGLALLFPAIMLTSLVYLGEHWVVDGFVGWAITGGAFWFWNRMERRTRVTPRHTSPARAGARRRAARRRPAVALGGGADMMDPPKVLLEASFLRAVVDDDDPAHAAATTEYARLVDEFEAERVLLVAVSTHLCALELPVRQGNPTSFAQHVGWFLVRKRRGPFAPVDPLHVGWQHRRAARRARGIGDSGVAMTLVICERNHVKRVATFDPVFEQFQLDLLPVPRVTAG